MATTTRQPPVDETKLTALLLHKKLITDGQLKAALDYQRSLGGRLVDTLIKLDLVRLPQLEEVLGKVRDGGDVDAKADADPSVLAPDSVTISELKVHRRLLEKLPRELVEKYLLVVFFPCGGVSKRKIILGHGREIPNEVREKVHGLVGVELCPLLLNVSVASGLLAENGYAVPSQAPVHEEATPRSEKAARAEQVAREERTVHEEREERADGGDNASRSERSPLDAIVHEEEDPIPSAPIRGDDSHDILLGALLSVLIKKGVLGKEDLEVEIELLRIRRRNERAPE